MPGVILGYFTDEEGLIPSSDDALRARGGALSAVALFWYRLRADGSGGIETHGVAGEPARAREVVAAARARGVRVLAVIHNLLYPRSRTTRAVAHAVLSDPQARSRAVGEIASLVASRGFDGVNIDLEFVAPEDRQLLTAFVAEVKDALAPAGGLVVVSVEGKEWDAPWDEWKGAYDYPALAEAADYIQVMAYQEHGPATGPGPIASLDWAERVARYAAAVVPPAKILWGIPAYGFDWNLATGEARYLDHAGALRLAGAFGATPSRDPASQAPTFTYYDEGGAPHEVWYEDAVSAGAKAALAARFGMGGIALWRLGMEDPAFWDRIQNP